MNVIHMDGDNFIVWNQDAFNRIKNEMQGSKPKRARNLPTIHEVREAVWKHPYYSSSIASYERPRGRSNSEPVPYLKSDMN